MIERLLVVGMGSIGRRHARLARLLRPNAEITVLRHRACDELDGTGIDYCVTTIEHALARLPQAAVIASPSARHLDSAFPLADAGVHLLVEKPISSSVSRVQDLLDLARMRGIKLLTGYNLRFLPSLVSYREFLRDGCIGRVLSVRAEVGQALPAWRPGSDYRKSVSARSDHGGGVLRELSHEIDYLRWLFGDIERLTALDRRQSDLEIDVSDTAILSLVFLPKAHVQPVVGSLCMDFVRHDATRRCTAIGDLGTIRWDAIAGRVELFRAGASDWETLYLQPPERDESYINEWRHFLDCVESGAAPLITGADGLAVIRVVEAAEAASSTGRSVSVPGAPAATSAVER